MKAILVTKGQQLTERMILVLVSLALLHIIDYSNTKIEYLCLFSIFGILFCLTLMDNLLTNGYLLIVFLYSLFSVMLTMISHGGMGASLIYMSVLLAMMVLGNSQVRLATYRKIYLLISVVLSFFILTTDLDLIHMSACYSFLGDRLNANSFGILVLANFYCWMCYLSTYNTRSILMVLLKAGITAGCAYFIYVSDCRSALVAMIAFICLSCVMKHPFTYLHFRRIVLLAVVVSISIVLVAVYLGDMLDDIQLMGTSILTSRQVVWKSALEYYFESPWIGNGGDIVFVVSKTHSTGSGHNTILSIMYTLGTVPALSFSLMLGRRLQMKRDYPYNRVAQFAFLSSLVLSFFESFYTDSHFFILYLMLLLSPCADGKRI